MVGGESWMKDEVRFREKAHLVVRSMNRRSWLRRRKSSEEIPSGETESSGSLSSHSERFSDDKNSSNHHNQSPEVTSKAAPGDEFNDSVKSLSEKSEVTAKAASGDELNDSVRILSEKLSEALSNIRAKEDIVKQHSKVAEEAASGWERSENEVLALRKLNDALNQKNSVLHERVGHLDGALNECLRQLGQARDEREEKICDALAKKNSEWEVRKSELENQLVGFNSKLENAKTDARNTLLADACSKLEAAERENSILKGKLLSSDQELNIRTNERDLSIRAAESASKLNLDSIRKVAKLEAEFRRLKMVANRAALVNDHQSVTASSVGVESFADSQSDNGERLLYIKNNICKLSRLDPNGELCHTDSWTSGSVTDIGQFKHGRTVGKSLIVPSAEIDLMDDFLEMEGIASIPATRSECIPGSRVIDTETVPRDEPESLIKRISDLEENLKIVTMGNVTLKIALDRCQIQLKESDGQLKRTDDNLVDLERKFTLADEEKRELQKELGAARVKLENLAKLLDEAEMEQVKFQDQLTQAHEAMSNIELQLQDANIKKAEADLRVKVIELEFQTSNSRLCELKEEVVKERKVSTEAVAKCDVLEAEISIMKSESQFQKSATMEEFSINRMQLKEANLKRVEAESRVKEIEIELEVLLLSIVNLEIEVEKERKFSRVAVNECENLEAEISRMQSQKSATFAKFTLNQDKELALAASKFTDCQNTIASLSRQLQSLATFDDFLIDIEQQVAVI